MFDSLHMFFSADEANVLYMFCLLTVLRARWRIQSAQYEFVSSREPPRCESLCCTKSFLRECLCPFGRRLLCRTLPVAIIYDFSKYSHLSAPDSSRLTLPCITKYGTQHAVSIMRHLPLWIMC